MSTALPTSVADMCEPPAQKCISGMGSWGRALAESSLGSKRFLDTCNQEFRRHAFLRAYLGEQESKSPAVERDSPFLAMPCPRDGGIEVQVVKCDSCHPSIHRFLPTALRAGPAASTSGGLIGLRIF